MAAFDAAWLLHLTDRESLLDLFDHTLELEEGRTQPCTQPWFLVRRRLFLLNGLTIICVHSLRAVEV